MMSTNIPNLKFEVGNNVFSKLKGYRPWPSVITNKLSKGLWTVKFYGTGEIATIKEVNLYRVSGMMAEVKESSKRNQSFRRALQKMTDSLSSKEKSEISKFEFLTKGFCEIKTMKCNKGFWPIPVQRKHKINNKFDREIYIALMNLISKVVVENISNKIITSKIVVYDFMWNYSEKYCENFGKKCKELEFEITNESSLDFKVNVIFMVNTFMILNNFMVQKNYPVANYILSNIKNIKNISQELWSRLDHIVPVLKKLCIYTDTKNAKEVKELNNLAYEICERYKL